MDRVKEFFSHFLGPSKQVDQSPIARLRGMFDDKEFMKKMLDIHASCETEIDVHSLFVLAENTLKGATSIVDSVVNPKERAPASGVDYKSVKEGFNPPSDVISELTCQERAPASGVDYKPVKEGFNPPSDVISELTCQLTCKALYTEDVREEKMVSLFQKLSQYSWVAKAVVTLSSLAIYYADLWRLAQVEPSDKHGESVAILKGLPAMTKPADVTKIQVFGVLNKMIKSILDMTRCIVEFEQESKDVPELSTAIDISTSVTQIIISILGCSIQFTTLISLVADESRRKDLSTFADKVSLIDETIKEHFKDFKQKKDEIREYRRLLKFFKAPTHNVELIKAIFYTKDCPPPLYLGSKKTTGTIDSLRKKHVLLLISDLNLSSDDLSIMANIYKAPNFNKSQYEILWVPIVDQEILSKDMQKQFENLQSQMPWYSAHCPTLINKLAVKIIRELWHFRQVAIVVKLDPQGKVECYNAMHVIRLLGSSAFPFTDSRVIEITDTSWFKLLVNEETVIPKIQEMIKPEKLIILYGSEDKHAHELGEDIKKISGDSGTPIVRVTKIPLFLARLESCMFSMMQAQIHVSDSLILQDILKLYTSFKKEGGFVLFARDSRVVINCSMMSIHKVVSQSDTWKKHVNLPGKTFEIAFKEYLDSVVPPEACLQFYTPYIVGHMPEDPNCPVCSCTMRNVVMFECCHGAHGDTAGGCA